MCSVHVLCRLTAVLLRVTISRCSADENPIWCMVSTARCPSSVVHSSHPSWPANCSWRGGSRCNSPVQHSQQLLGDHWTHANNQEEQSSGSPTWRAVEDIGSGWVCEQVFEYCWTGYSQAIVMSTSHQPVMAITCVPAHYYMCIGNSWSSSLAKISVWLH